jgi:upstream activation factor subunit UAF30
MSSQLVDARRKALEVLSRDWLVALVDSHDLDVRDRRARDPSIDALVGVSDATFLSVLEQLPRTALKEMCNALELNDGGREKRVIIERIVAALEGKSAPEDLRAEEDDDAEEYDQEDKAAKGDRLFHQLMRPSAALARVVGPGPLSRTEIVKRIWAYVKEHGLQDQHQKRNINADEAFQAVFGGKKTVTMFEMTALVNKSLELWDGDEIEAVQSAPVRAPADEATKPPRPHAEHAIAKSQRGPSDTLDDGDSRGEYRPVPAARPLNTSHTISVSILQVGGRKQ